MFSPQRMLTKFVVLATMLLGLPLLGVAVAGFPIARYLEFPPQTRYVEHAPFSWPPFFIISLIILAAVILTTVKAFQSHPGRPGSTGRSKSYPFPWWGRIGIATGVSAWLLAWTRFSWFAGFQPHTFSPLWFSYILVVNALCQRRTGRCLMTDRPVFFLLLFPTSAVFWWFFEFLNRFVQNWYYVGATFSPWAYFWYATLPFSTVLPAVLSTRQYLLSSGWIRRFFYPYATD